VVSFRFHLVSITAVFLALALGIAMGATVVDRATVDLLERRLDTVRAESERTDKANEELRAELNRWNQFTSQAGDRLVKDRLAGVPVIAIFVEGSDRGSFDALRQTVAAAGAVLQGTVVLTNKLALRDNDDIDTLRVLADAAAARPPDLRRIVASQVAAAVTAAANAEPLGALIDKGFARLEGVPGGRAGVATLVIPSLRYIVVADGKAAAPNAELAQPLVDQLAEGAAPRVVAAEAGRNANGDEPAVRAQFLGPLRAQKDGRVSTIDDLEEYAGRVATVLALQAMADGKVGHYGVGPGASRLLPDSP
jgi:hypothetical protein